MATLDGKVALVTGASGGIGAAVARALAREGARVAVVARREAESGAVVEGIRANLSGVFYGIGRMSAPDEQAAVVTFLCGPASSFIVGAAVPVDGGWRLG